MQRRHLRTLKAFEHDPVLSGISWIHIEALLVALGAEITEGQGSRVRIVLNGARAVFHRPHPEKETDKGAVKAMRRFLQEAEVHHDDV